MTLHIVLGQTGSGKTTYQTAMGHLRYDEGYTLCSNYTLYDIDYIPLTDFTNMLEIEGDKLCFLLDEWWLNADARRSSSILSLANRVFANQHRKKHADVWITSQRGKGQLELTWLSQCNEFYEPSVLINDEYGKPLILEVDYKFFMKNKIIKGSFPFPCQIETEHGYMDIPNEFNTYEIVNKSEINLEKQYESVINNYIGIAGDLKKGELISLLQIQENIPHSTAQMLSDYMNAQTTIYNLNKAGLLNNSNRPEPVKHKSKKVKAS